MKALRAYSSRRYIQNALQPRSTNNRHLARMDEYIHLF